MRFYLGVHNPSWLATAQVPLFVSYAKLSGRRTFPRARTGWALDSSAFSQLSAHGRWTISPEAYADDVRRLMEDVGELEWASIQDWMCEPSIRDKTGLNVRQHQERTTANYVKLFYLDFEIPWVPVLQGWHAPEYLRHVAIYKSEGIDLTTFPTVGVGSVCRRQGTREATAILRSLADLGIKVHAFGFKTNGLPAVRDFIESADSLAWSFHARKQQIRMEGCTHARCNNCLRYALLWRKELLRKVNPLPTIPGPGTPAGTPDGT